MTTKYIFKAEHMSDPYNGDEIPTTTTKEFCADTIDDILAEFREFLLGVGFSPKTLERYELEDN